MTDTGHEPILPGCAPATRVVLIGAPSPLRSAIFGTYSLYGLDIGMPK